MILSEWGVKPYSRPRNSAWIMTSFQRGSDRWQWGLSSTTQHDGNQAGTRHSLWEWRRSVWQQETQDMNDALLLNVMMTGITAHKKPPVEMEYFQILLWANPDCRKTKQDKVYSMLCLKCVCLRGLVWWRRVTWIQMVHFSIKPRK